VAATSSGTTCAHVSGDISIATAPANAMHARTKSVVRHRAIMKAWIMGWGGGPRLGKRE
jgi:hypothetical protein